MFSKKMLMSYLNSYTLLVIGLVLVLLGTLLYKYRENFVLTSRLRKELILFHMEGCGHCEALMPIWEKFQTTYGENQYIDVANINITNHPDVADKYGLERFPTIAYLKDGEIVDIYSGDRTYGDLVRYLNYAIAN
jgi:thioredoxin 1